MRVFDYIRVVVCVLIACVCAPCVYAQETSVTDDSVYVLYRQSASELDLNFGDNGRRLDDFLRSVERYKSDSVFLVSQRIYISSYASLEGNNSYNRRLARERAKSLHSFLSKKIALPDSVIVSDKRYFDWQMLANKVAASQTPNKEQVLNIIATVPEEVRLADGRVVFERIRQLRLVGGGAAWNYMYKHHFPQMRYAKIQIISKRQLEEALKEKPVHPVIQDTVPKPAAQPEPAPAPEPKAEVVPAEVPVVESPQPAEVDTSWHRRLDIKTNAIGLGMMILNAGVEIDIIPRLSFALPIYYSGINYFTETVKFRTFCVQPELRYWFFKQQHGNDRLFLGAHFGMAYYNFALNGDYRIQDHAGRKPALGGGLSVGYRLPLGKEKRWKMEFSLGAGVYALHYDKFFNEHDGKLTKTIKRTFIGLDNAAISVGYTFDVSKKKAKK